MRGRFLKRILGGLLGALTLGALVSCGVKGGYAITGTVATYNFLLVSNFGGNTLSAFYLEADGNLVQSATTVSVSGGSNPSTLALTSDKSRVYATMFNSDSIAGFTVDGLNATYPSAIAPLTGTSLFAAGSGPSAMVLSETHAYLVSNDLATSNVHVLAMESGTGALSSQSTVSAKLNPSGVALSPSGGHLYVTNTGSANLSVFAVDADTGNLAEIGGSPYNVQSNPTHLAMDPTGQTLLVVNSGSNSVSAFTVDASTGELTLVGHTPVGTNPKQVAIDPTSAFAYVTNEASDDIFGFSLTPATGVIAPLADSPFTLAGQEDPYAVAIEPSGEYLVASWGGSGSISVFSLDSTTGALTAVGDPMPSGNSPRFIQPYQFVVYE